MSFEDIEFEKVCRTCLAKDGTMRSIFSIDQSTGEARRLCEMLMMFTSIKILEDDGLPAQVCFRCLHQITQASFFKELCEKSDATLRSVLEKRKQTKTAPNEQNKNFENVEIKKESESSVSSDAEGKFNEVYINELVKSEIHSEDSESDIEMKMDCEESGSAWDCEDDKKYDLEEVQTDDSLTKKSHKLYRLRYADFMKWCESKNISNCSEETLLAYFSDPIKNFKPPSLYPIFSMLKSMLMEKQNVDIRKYKKLNNFIKQNTKNHKPKKAKILSKNEILQFLQLAPDEKFLMAKVALIFGIYGACRCDELHQLKSDNIEELEDMIVVTIDSTDIRRARTFTISNSDGSGIDYVGLYKKYSVLRSSVEAAKKRFFLKYQKGRCINQVVGINTLGRVPSVIATYLNLEDPDDFTAHSFRKSAAALLESCTSVGNAYGMRPESSKLFSSLEIKMDPVNAKMGEIECEEEKQSSDMEVEPSEATGRLLSEKSRMQYEKEYDSFQNWKMEKNIDCLNESVLVAYFSEKSKTVKPSTLWSYYSMLKSTLLQNENTDISEYRKLVELLKKLTDGYKPRKSKVFEAADVITFLKEAPDEEFLVLKVVAIMGLYGACRSDELHKLEVSSVEDRKSVIVVSISDSKLKKKRTFCITDRDCGGVSILETVRKYMSLRPQNVPHNKFFVSYRDRKCTVQPVGINTIYKAPKRIADFLKLPNPEMYTAHCFRTSAEQTVGKIWRR